MIFLGRKNTSRGKNKNLTDFSYLINKPEDVEIEEDKDNKIEENKEKED